MDFLGMHIPMHIVKRSRLLSDLYDIYGNSSPMIKLESLFADDRACFEMIEINCRFVLRREKLGIERNDLCKPEDIPEINAIYDLIFDYLGMDC